MQDNKEKITSAILIPSFFILTVFLFTPLNVYFTNLENAFFYSDVLTFSSSLLFLSALLILCVSLIILRLKSQAFKRSISVLFTLSVLFWLFSNILVWDCGVFNGSKFYWGKTGHRAFLEPAVWLFCILFLTFRTDFIYRISRKISALLIVVQLAALTFLGTQNLRNPEELNFLGQIVYHEKFTFSKKKNIIILVLDSFQTDFFQEIINQENNYKTMLEGFTYFRNAAGGYASTAHSTPLILTGKYYDNSLPKKEFVKNALLSDSSISKILKQNGFIADLYPSLLFHCDNKILSNYIGNDKYIAHKKFSLRRFLFNKMNIRDYIVVSDIILFRLCPYSLKKYLYPNRSLFLSRFIQSGTDKKKRIFSKNSLNDKNVAFIQELHSKIKIGYDQPAFKYYHRPGMHIPLYLDDDLKYHFKPLPMTRGSFIKNGKAQLQLIGIFIDILKSKDIYDDSMIFIISDHGTVYEPLDIRTAGYSARDNASKKNGLPIGIGLPLVLVKPFNSQGQLAISDAPVSLSDIGPTIFEELNITTAEKTGISMFKIDKNKQRARRFFNHTWQTAEQSSDYLPWFEEYEISGFSWLKSSWKLKRKFPED